MKTADEINISKKEKRYLLQRAIETLGEEKQLVIGMEEISELINVMSTNILEGFNYIHTAEEVADVRIHMKVLAIIGDIPLPKSNKELNIGKKKMKLFTWYAQLSKAQQYISKYIRNGALSKDKLVVALQLIDSATTDIIAFCGIHKRDISKIENLKYKRLQDRLRNTSVK